MSRGRNAMLVLTVVVCAGAAAAWGVSQWLEDVPPGGKVSAGSGIQGGGLEGTGVVQYDPPGSADSMLGNYGSYVGNVFDTRANNPLETGNLSAMAFYLGGADATFPFIGVFDLTPFVTVSTNLFSGLNPFSFNTVPLYVGSISPPFFAGVLLSSAFSSSADSIGMQSQSTLGQGFHAGSLVGPGNVVTLGSNNAMVRVQGSVWVVPVELMGFDVE